MLWIVSVVNVGLVDDVRREKRREEKRGEVRWRT